MADFPTNPVNGDTHVIASSTWEYYLSTDRWEIQDTSGVPQTVNTLLQTITWSAGDNNVVSNPIIYSNYASLIITYVNVLGNTSNSSFKMCKPHQVVGQLDCINPRTYADGEGIMTMNGTQTINASSGTSISVINLNGTEVTTSHSNTIGADYDPITFGWTTGAFAAGGSIEIRGISLQIQPNSLESLSNVHTTVPTDGQVLTWDNTNSYWKPDDSGGSSPEIIGGHFTTIDDAGTAIQSLGASLANKKVLVTRQNAHGSQLLTANASGQISVVHGSSSDPETWYWQSVI